MNTTNEGLIGGIYLVTGGTQGNLLNPQITVFLDVLGSLSDDGSNNALNRFSLREVEVDFRAAIAPFADGVLVAAFGEDTMALGLARIEAHYFKNGIFLEDGVLLGNVERMRRIPGTIVQGRYDVVCPIATADEFARAWPEADYVVVPDAGHSAMEPGIRRALVAATERFKAPG